MSSTLPPPAETLARVMRGTRLALAPAGASLHVLAGKATDAAATRCGHRTSATWQAYDGADASRVPCLRLCPRCVAGLPLELRRRLEPTPAELRRVYEREARHAAEDLRQVLAKLRTAALVDGAAYERTRLVEAHLAPQAVAGQWHHYERPATRAERDARAGGHVATARELTLLELLNELEPIPYGLAGRRVWLVDEPAIGSPVDVGGTYDPRLWQGRRR